ncbi:MAG: hypothetical protein J6Y97_02935 [Prevotella sp.]|nr:hypothetical protein [Prevotella sp.]
MMMEREHIQKLLDRYMSAETTKEEEQFLYEYFSSHRDIPAEWRNFSILFRGIKKCELTKDASHNKRNALKWCAAAAVIVFIFGIGLLGMHQEETSKPSEIIAQTKEIPTIDDKVSMQEIILEEKPVVAKVKQTRLAKSTRSVRNDKSVTQKEYMQKEKEEQHISKMLEDADKAFSLATLQCTMNIDESFLQDEKREETDNETNIFL